MTEVFYVVLGALLSHLPAVLVWIDKKFRRLEVAGLCEDLRAKEEPDTAKRTKAKTNRLENLRRFVVFRALPEDIKDLWLHVGRVATQLKASAYQEVKGVGDDCLRLFILYDIHVLKKDTEVWNVLEKIFSLEPERLMLRTHYRLFPDAKGKPAGFPYVEISVGPSLGLLRASIAPDRFAGIHKEVAACRRRMIKKGTLSQNYFRELFE